MPCNLLVKINGVSIAHDGPIQISSSLESEGNCSFTLPVAIDIGVYDKLEILDGLGAPLFLGVVKSSTVSYAQAGGKTEVQGASLYVYLKMKTVTGNFEDTTVIDLLEGLADTCGWGFGISVPVEVAEDPISLTFDGNYFEEVVTQVAEQIGARWYVDIETGVLAFRLTGDTSSTHSIVYPEACQKIDGPYAITWSLGTPTYSKATVGGENYALHIITEIGALLPVEEVTTYEILQEAGRRNFGLLEKVSRVIQVEMLPTTGFIIVLNPSESTVTEGTGDSIIVEVTVSPFGEFTGVVNLSYDGPDGTTGVFDEAAPDIVDENPIIVTLTITPDDSVWTVGAEDGMYTVTGEGEGTSLTASAEGEIIIEPEIGGDPYYAVSVSPSTDTIYEGGCVSYTVTVTPFNGYTGTVDLSLAYPLPAGTTHTFTPASVVITEGAGVSTLEICDVNVNCEPENPCDPEYIDFQMSTVAEPGPGEGSENLQCPDPFYSGGDVTLTCTWTVTLFCNGIEVSSYTGVRAKTVAWNCGGWEGRGADITEEVTTPFGGFTIFSDSMGCVACN